MNHQSFDSKSTVGRFLEEEERRTKQTLFKPWKNDS
jgi:hypothetical protein